MSRIRKYPVTTLLLYNAELDPLIIAEQRPIYLGFSPAEATPAEAVSAESVPAESAPAIPAAPAEAVPTEATPTESDRAEGDPQSDPQEVSDSPAAAVPAEVTAAESVSTEATPTESDHDQSDHDQSEHAEDEDARSDQDAAMEYLNRFVRHNVLFYKGCRLTSSQVKAAIESVAPDGIRTDLIDRKTITFAVRERFGIGMEKRSARIDGKHQKYWKDFRILLD